MILCFHSKITERLSNNLKMGFVTIILVQCVPYVCDVYSVLYNILFTPPKIVEGLYFHCNLSVCVSVCPALLVNKIPAERMNLFRRDFR